MASVLHAGSNRGRSPASSSGPRRFCAWLSTHLVFVSKDNEEEAALLDIGPTKPDSLIRSGILIQDPPLLSKIREELGISQDAWVVVSVGNFKPQKNPMDLAKTAKAVLAQKDPSISVSLRWRRRAAARGGRRKEISSGGIFRPRAFPRLVQPPETFPGDQRPSAASNCFLLTSLWGRPAAGAGGSGGRASALRRVCGQRRAKRRPESRGKPDFPIPHSTIRSWPRRKYCGSKTDFILRREARWAGKRRKTLVPGRRI